MENGDLVVKYKDDQPINSKLDKEIENLFKTLGYKWVGSGVKLQGFIRDIQFRKE